MSKAGIPIKVQGLATLRVDRFAWTASQTFAHLSPDSRYTFATEGDPEIRVTGKEDKAGVTVMVTSTTAGKVLPMQVIAKGTTLQALKKFVDGSNFTREAGGFEPNTKAAAAKAAKGQSVVRKTLTDEKKLAEQRPYNQDPWSGHMIEAGVMTSIVSYLMNVAYRAFVHPAQYSTHIVLSLQAIQLGWAPTQALVNRTTRFPRSFFRRLGWTRGPVKSKYRKTMLQGSTTCYFCHSHH